MALTYTFHLPGNCALSAVSVTDADGDEVDSGTTDSNATFSSDLAVGDYTASVEKGRIAYTAAGELTRSGSAADSDSEVTSVNGQTGAVDLSATYAPIPDEASTMVTDGADSSASLSRIGQVVQAQFAFDQAPAASVAITIPAGYRPVSPVYGVFLADGVDATAITVETATGGAGVAFGADVSFGGCTLLWLTDEADPS